MPTELHCDCCHQPVVYDADAECFHKRYYNRDCGERGAYLHLADDCGNLIIPYEVEVMEA